MVLSYKLLKKQENDFVKVKKIPLGINTYRGNNPDKKHIVTIPYKKRGSIVIIATSQWGKSTLLKRILNYRWLFNKDKAWLTIDTQGRDHRYLGKPNNHSKPLFTNYGEIPMGIEDVISYCLMFASKRAFPEDKIIGITLNDLNPRDLLSSDIEDNQMREFFKIKQMSENNRRIMDDPKEFFIEFAKIPSRKRDGTISSLDYPADTLMNYGIKEALETKFSWWMGYQPSDNEKPEWMGKEQWNLQKRPPYFVSKNSRYHKPSFWNEYKQKKKVLLNFMDAKEEWEGMAIHGGFYLRDAYEYCSLESEKNKNFKGMDINIEETNLFIDPKDKYLKKGSNYYVTELLCRGYKFEIHLIANFQIISSVNLQIRNHLTSGSNPVIIGNLTKRDREFLDVIFPNVKELKLRDRVPGCDWGGKEWAIYYNDRIYDTFVPYPSLSMFKVDKRS